MKTQKKYGRVHKKRALTHKKRKLSKKIVKGKNKNRVKSRRRKTRTRKTRTRKTRKYKKGGVNFEKGNIFGVGSSLPQFSSGIEEEEVYGFKEMCAPGYMLVEKDLDDGSKDKMYACVEDDRIIEGADPKASPSEDFSYHGFADVAGVLY